jgi:hypothetical protein
MRPTNHNPGPNPGSNPGPNSQPEPRLNAPQDEPIELEPDDPNEIIDDHTIYRRKPKHQLNFQAPDREQSPANGNVAGKNESAESTIKGEALQWALEVLNEPAMASADWLARDIDPTQQTAVGLLTNPKITRAQVKQAKAVFKTMRIVGEKAADRRIGARMYAVAIAVGLVRFGEKISTQSDDALDRGFQGVVNDRRMPEELRNMAGKAICMLRELKDSARSKSA